MENVAGYGARSQWQNLMFDGDERKYELWETKILGYLRLRGLKETVFNPPVNNDSSREKDENACGELIQFLDDRSLELVMSEAADNGYRALQILLEHYSGHSKPRIITLYHQLTTLNKKEGKNVTDFIIRAESAATALKAANENVSDALSVGMVLKGFPEEYTPFIAVVSQSEEHQNFQRFKGALRNYKETKKARKVVKVDNNKDAILKTKGGNFKVKQKKDIECYTCGKKGHKSSECYKNTSSRRRCSKCKSTTYTDKTCRKSNDNANMTFDFEDEHPYGFQLPCDGTFLFDCGATTHIVNKEDCFIDFDESFDPSKHFIELANGKKIIKLPYSYRQLNSFPYK